MKERMPWTPQQDKVVKLLKQDQKIKKWSVIAKMMEQQYNLPVRSGKQCRQRYINFLDSNINHEQWTIQEEKILYSMHQQNGNRWTLMARHLKGRTQNCIKNHFYSKVRKSVRRLNKYIAERHRIQFKQIKTSMLYKIIEVAQQRFKPGKYADNFLIDKCIEIKNQLFLYEEQIQKHPQKQPKITKDLISQIKEMTEILKKQDVCKLNSSGFLVPKNRRHNISVSFDSSDISSMVQSSFNSSNYLESQSLGSPIFDQKLQKKSQSLGSSLKDINQLKSQEKLNLLNSVDLKHSRSQKSFNWDINSDRVSDIDQRKSLSKSDHDFDDFLQSQGQQFILQTKQNTQNIKQQKPLRYSQPNHLQIQNLKQPQGHFRSLNYFDQPQFTNFPPIRIISPKHSLQQFYPSQSQNYQFLNAQDINNNQKSFRHQRKGAIPANNTNRMVDEQNEH